VSQFAPPLAAADSGAEKPMRLFRAALAQFGRY
jgi:hypothetical protein